MNSFNFNTILGHFAKRDKAILRLIKIYGKCNLTPKKDYFNQLLSSIISQQLSVKSANAIYNRFRKLFTGKPTPEKLIKIKIEELRESGLSNAKSNYCLDLAYKLMDGTITFKNISQKSDEEIHYEFTKVKGIGTWTVHMFLIFTLGRYDILPYGDLGIKRAIMLNYGFEKLPNEKEVKNLAKKMNWAPYSSYAAWYLWKSLD